MPLPPQQNLSGRRPWEEGETIASELSSLPKNRSRPRARILGWIWVWLLRLQRATWHSEVEGLERLDERIARGKRTLLTFWHGKYLPLFALLQGRTACVFTSQSFRGEVIAEMCRCFGYTCVQIPDDARHRSLDLLRQALVTHRMGGIAVDGPLGPYHVVKHMPIQLASELSFVLLPVSVASRRKWVLTRRWDRMEVPRPFTRVYLVIGEALEVPPSLTRGAVELWGRRLHDALEALDRQAEEKVRGTAPADPTCEGR